MPAPPLAGRPDAQGTLCHHGPACGGPPSIEQRLPEEGGGAGTRSDMPFERTRQRRLHAASFPSRATVIADSSCRAVPGRWTLEPGAPLGWTPTRGVGGVSPQCPLLLGSQHPWNLALEDSRVENKSLLSSTAWTLAPGQWSPGWATVVLGTPPGKGPSRSGCSWTRTHAVPSRGCPQPHLEAGLGGRRVGGRAGGSGAAPSTACRRPPLLICLDHRSGPRVALGLSAHH